MLRTIGAVVLFVQDLDGMKTYYRDVFGFEVAFEDEVSFALRTTHNDFAVVKASTGADMVSEDALGHGGGHRFMLCADVEDVDAEYRELSDKGVTFIKPPISQPWGWRTAYFVDPEGNIWELRQAIPAQS